MRRTASTAAAAVALLAASAVTACNSHPKAHAVASSSTSTAVQAGEQAAAALLQSCITAVHVAQAESCIEGKVPAPKRVALKTCLGTDAVAALKHSGHVMATFRAGAQPCVVTALKP